MSEYTTIAEALGSYVATTSPDAVPDVVREKAKLCLLDSLGCILGGATLAPGRQISALVQAWGGVPQATVALAGRVPYPWAAYANGYLANLLDFDDTTPLGHPGASVVPTALALGEWYHRSGRDLLAALVVGYEVSLRVGIAIRPTPERERLLRGMGTWQIFGAAGAAARLLHLDASQSAHALALAVNHAPVPCMRKFGHQERPISWIKNNLGWANLGGILAAELASHGMAANLTNFDGESGFWIMAGADERNFGTYAAGIGQEYRLLDVGFKPYPACLGLHTTLDAVQALQQRYNIQAHQVRRIVVSGAHKLLDYADPGPQTIPDAQFSIPYVTAMLLRGQAPGCAWFAPENMRSPEVAALARKVEFAHDDESETRLAQMRIAARVRIELKDGRTAEETVVVPRGDPEHPLSPAELEAKFLALATPVLGSAPAQHLLEHCQNLEQLDDTARLAGLLGKESRS